MKTNLKPYNDGNFCPTSHDFMAILCRACSAIGDGCPVLLGTLPAGWPRPQTGLETRQTDELVSRKNTVYPHFAAGLASFDLLPNLYHSFINDVSGAAAEAVVNSAGAAIDGTLETPDVQELKEMASGVVWGEMDPTQYESLTLMSAFWLFFGWCCYLAGYCASPVNFFIKLVKALGYCCLSSAMILLPMCMHQFTWEEFESPFYFLAIAAICIAATHSWTRKMPPPLPPAPSASHTTPPNDPNI